MQQIIDSEHFSELIAAEQLGLVPDDWAQAGTVAAAVQNSMSKTRTTPEDFRPKVVKPMTREQQVKLGNNLQKLTWRT